ncbi:hypoxia inducible factor 1 subunit alpha, like 2 isoform X1 [Scleropages formosus]|uniref:hypoxia inducible factor 1 subunit alpha, like 2 isoform X1 n=1 Tax=Scleropages formosus TaxID=113540 RepID=UPI0010FAB1E0|nr:hypoxia-inducible factor 1-alpha-like isoform X1 [Scleropages formosus]
MSEAKRKRLSSEWRRARSRASARSRRERESQLFRELAGALPSAPGPAGHMDKASLIRLTLTYLRLREILDDLGHMQSSADGKPHAVCPGTPGARPSQTNQCGCNSGTTPCDEKVLDSALGGFMLLVSHSGQVIYATGAVTAHTGINQMDLIGQSLFQFMHPSDLREMREILSSKTDLETQKQRDLFLRMKCTLTCQGRTVNLKSASWKVLHCTGVRRPSVALGSSCLILLCQPLPDLVPSAWDAYLNCTAFLSRHTLDMRFSYCQPRVSEFIGYTETELLGQSVYRYYHALDCEHILKTHLSLFSKGKVSTGKYRLLVKNGGFVWVETNATVVYSSRSGQPQSVICINYILSEVEQPDVLFSLEQKEYLLKPIPCSSITASSLSPQGSGYRGCSEFTAEESVPSPVHETGDRMETEHTVPITETLLELDREDIPEEAAQEFSEEDLDTLAPYIPMDGEDFLLSPISEEVDDKADMGQQGCYLDCFVLPCFDVQSYAKADSNCNSPGPCDSLHGPLFPSMFSQISSPPTSPVAPMPLDSKYWQREKSHYSKRIPDGSGQWRYEDCLWKRHWNVGRFPHSRDKQQCGCPSWTYRQPAASQWRKIKPDPISYTQVKETVPGWWSSGEPTNGYERPLGFVPWAPQYSDPPSSPPDRSSIYSGLSCPLKAEWTGSVLPVLSPLECEVNAPVDPASCLLRGPEIISVLDQATYRFCP